MLLSLRDRHATMLTLPTRASAHRLQARAEKTYKTMLERFPTSVKVLRSYAKFLEDVRNDPWAATKFYA